MNAQHARRRPSASMIVSLTALFVALADSGSAATFGNFILGKTNRPTRTTGIAAKLAHQVFAITNTGTGAAGSFTVKPGAPPFKVNSAVKVGKLNADLLDGQDSTSFWNVKGNAGTNPGTNFIGTTDNQPLVVRTDNQESLRVDVQGNVGIGTTNPSTKLAVAELTTTGDVVLSSANAGTGVHGAANSGNGVLGTSTSGIGVSGSSTNFRGVQGNSSNGIGVLGDSTTGRGVVGTLGGGSCPGAPYAVGGCGGTVGAGVLGSSTAQNGVTGSSSTGTGVMGESTNGIGVYGDSTTRGIVGTLSKTPCPGTYAVGACGATGGDGLFAAINHAPNGSTAAAVHALNTGGGDIFLGESGTNRTRVARIDGTGKGYFDGGTQNSGADYADSMRADSAAKLRPGDVLAIDPTKGNTVSLSHEPNSSLVAGVYSTKPAVLGVGNHRLGNSLAGQVPVALVGIVPTRVSAENGPVEVGDLLTTSNTPGYAMKAVPVMVHGIPVYPTGTVLGKALQPLTSGRGMIKVLVTLR